MAHNKEEICCCILNLTDCVCTAAGECVVYLECMEQTIYHLERQRMLLAVHVKEIPYVEVICVCALHTSVCVSMLLCMFTVVGAHLFMYVCAVSVCIYVCVCVQCT